MTNDKKQEKTPPKQDTRPQYFAKETVTSASLPSGNRPPTPQPKKKTS